MRAYLAELLGTFGLVLVGTGAIIVNDVSGGLLGNAGIALAFAVIVFLMICSFAHLSGAHINPAVSMVFALTGHLAWRKLGNYWLAQCCGALLASGLLHLLFQHATLGATVPTPKYPALLAFGLEIVISSILMLSIFYVIQQHFSRIKSAALIGSVVGLAAFLVGPLTGASMNPARSLGPALISGHFQHLWIYLTAPILGMLLAVPACQKITRKTLCASGACCNEVPA
ncbi:MAG: aquaporin [Gammaproteobacteria bacterium]|nr:aquaporin [Gammaproteobacteria bacterium]